jgi:paraquat-inducible protein A
MTAAALTAAQAGLVTCTSCGLLSRPADPAAPGYCPRCGTALTWRRPHATQYTWALIVAASIWYLPANLLPVLTTRTPRISESHTILGGVVSLYTSGQWALALIVLLASVTIPIGKLVVLTYLLVTVQRRSPQLRGERTLLYRLIRAIGRWSMLDVFVATFTVALVQLPPLMAVDPGPGVPFFGGVVVLTMIATECFDPRLVWDPARNSGGLDA